MDKVSYVAGFLFNDNGNRVVLIEKERPEWQRGKFNGIGGHIEEGETPEQAMRREFKEETGVDLEGWKRYVTLKGQSDVEWEVHFFAAFNTRAFLGVEHVSDERPYYFALDEINTEPVIPNLRWLIPMALSMKNENAAGFVVEEVY